MRPACNRLHTLGGTAPVHYLAAFTVSVVFASLRYAQISRPVVLVVYLALSAVFLFADVLYRRTSASTSWPRRLTDALFSSVFPLACSIGVLDWVFQHTSPRGFRGLEVENSDEAWYVRMMRDGILSIDIVPYRFRWLTPLLIGRFNILPVEDLSGFTVLNFAALIVTSVVLIRILQELQVNRALALLVPFFVFHAYLGRYAAWNHYLTDPATYMFFALVLWCLLDRRRYRHLGWLLVLGCLNSEKAIYWLPIVLIVLLKYYRLRNAMVRALAILGPAATAFLVPRLVLGHGLAANITPPQPSPANIALLISLPPSYIYFPFGFLTIFFVIGFNRLPSVLKMSSLILLPIYAQVYVAGYRGDVDRMIAYAFIILIPASLYYVQTLFGAMPYELGVVTAIPLLLVAYFNHKFTLLLPIVMLLIGTEVVPYVAESQHPVVRAARATLHKHVS
jgi:hypothetical protein